MSVKQSKVKNTKATKPVVELPTDTSESETDMSLIPSSRVKNYISKEKLNKELNLLIEQIKTSNDKLDLSQLLTEEQQTKIGGLIKEKENKGEEVNINNVVVDFLSKQKYKFSKTSFKVISVFLDLLVEDITLNVMDEIVKNKKSIINTKYVFNELSSNSKLYTLYNTLPTYMNEKNKNVSSEETTDETHDEEDSTESNDSNINFEFYVKKICNKLKKQKDEYEKIKVSKNFQKFCSNLILDFLDTIQPITIILLDVMTTKTITNVVFETVLKLQLYNNPNSDEIMNELKKRLS